MMSLMWNWGLSSVRRRCSFTQKSFPSVGNRIEFSTSLSSYASSSLASSSIVRSSLSPLSPASQHILPSMRFKSGMKTNSGCKKRFRVRGSGSIKRGKSGKSHNTGFKSRQRVNRLGSSTGIKGKKNEQNVRKLLGVY